MKKTIKVFIASPGDLAEERRCFRNTIEKLNSGFGDGANVEFKALGWEDTLATTGRRNQGVINTDIDGCDVFILVMHRRWGQPAPDAKPYSSYTEEEFHRALNLWQTKGQPEIFIFFKRVDAASEADAGPQLKKVIDFRKQLEETKKILYRYFDNDSTFTKEIENHLRAYVKEELPKSQDQNEIVLLPSSALEKIKEAKAELEIKTAEAKQARDTAEQALLKISILELRMAEDAAKLSMEGKIEFSRQKFAELLVSTNSTSVLALAYEFFMRTGDLKSAEEAVRKCLSICNGNENSEAAAIAYGNLGDIHLTRGDLNLAEESLVKSLSIHELINNNQGKAKQYGSLGTLHHIRKHWDRAEVMYQKALTIEKEAGNNQGIANQYGNLGNLYHSLGDIEKAEEMHLKSLQLEIKMGRKSGIAADYGNLGVIYHTKGDLKRAEQMYKESLKINESIDRKEGIASSLTNLASLYFEMEDSDKSLEMLLKSLAIEESLGRKPEIASDSYSIGVIYESSNNLSMAKEMYSKALSIYKDIEDSDESINCTYRIESIEKKLKEQPSFRHKTQKQGQK